MDKEQILKELSEVVEVKVVIKQELLAGKLFDLAVMPLLKKITEIIPTEIDDALLLANEAMLKAQFAALIESGINVAEDKTGLDLDGQEG